MNRPRPAPAVGTPIRCVHVIVPEPEGSVGGVDMHVRDLATAQTRRGRSIPVVFETLSRSFAGRIRDAGVACHSLAGRPSRTILPELRRLIVEQRVDVIHSHGYDSTWWAVAALGSLRDRPKLVVTCHGWIETTPKLRLMSALDRALNRCASGVIVVSDELVATALDHARTTKVFAVIPNGIPVRPLRTEPEARRWWGLPTDRPLVGAIGRLSLEKRHDVFVEACRLVGSQRPDVHFVLAGGGPLAADIARQVADVGLTGRFHLLGVVEDPEVLLSELAVVVQPSDAETTSRVVLEAMMQARAIVATDVGGTGTLLRHGVDGVLVPPGDPGRIAAEVIALLGAPTATACLGVSARLTAMARFDVAAMTAAVEDVYGAVLGREALLHSTWTCR